MVHMAARLGTNTSTKQRKTALANISTAHDTSSAYDAPLEWDKIWVLVNSSNLVDIICVQIQQSGSHAV